MSYELVRNAYERAQLHKYNRGITTQQPIDFDLRFIHNWQKVTLEPGNLRNLQLHIAPFISDGAYRIFRELHTTRLDTIAENITLLRRDPIITKWLSTIDDGLKKHILKNKRSPLIVINQPFFSWGNIYDGCHTALAILLLEKRGISTTITAFKGDSRNIHRLIRNFCDFNMRGDISRHERVKIMNERKIHYRNAK